MRRIGGFGAIAILLWVTGANGVPPAEKTQDFSGLGPGAQAARVVRVDADGVLWLTGGRPAKLACIQPGPGAIDALQQNLLGQDLVFRGAGHDRYGRLRGQAVAAGGNWVQADLVRRGLARVWCFAGEAGPMLALLAVERNARAARAGLWADPKNMPLTADAVSPMQGLEATEFVIVEDYVLSVTAIKGVTYLNFGDDWRRDFTVKIPRPVASRMRRAGRAADSLAGRLVRVRGWIIRQNGPMIELTHPEQLELAE